MRHEAAAGSGRRVKRGAVMPKTKNNIPIARWLRVDPPSLLWGDVSSARVLTRAPLAERAARVLVHSLVMILIAIVCAIVFGFTNDRSATVGGNETVVNIHQCHVALACKSHGPLHRVETSVSHSDSGVTIDGTDTERCAVSLCVEDYTTRSEMLTLVLSKATVDLTGWTDAVPFPVVIKNKSFQGTLHEEAAKVALGRGRFHDLFINISRGVVTAEYFLATTATIIVRHGPVILDFDFFNAPFVMTGSTRDNAYCVSENVTFTPHACGNATHSAAALNITSMNFTSHVCPFEAVSNTGSNPQMVLAVSSTSLYLNAVHNNATRIAGDGMDDDPRLDLTVLGELADTERWHEAQLQTLYVQVVDVITPTLGVAFSIASRKVLMEIGPDRLAFYSAFVMQPHYRRMRAVLSHYGCPAGAPRSLLGNLRPQSLTAYFSHDDDTEAQLRESINRFLPPESQFLVAKQIYDVVGDSHALVGIDSQAQQPKTFFEKLFGTARIVLHRDDDGIVTESGLRRSGSTIALMVINHVLAVVMVIGVNLLLVVYRVEILTFILAVDMRQKLRDQVSRDIPLCAYHYCLSFSTMVTWVAFRAVCRLLFLGSTPSNFVATFFRTARDTPGGLATPLVFGRVQEMYRYWALQRYDTPTVTDLDLTSAIEANGGQRSLMQKAVVRGLKLRDAVPSGAVAAHLRLIPESFTRHDLMQFFTIADDSDETFVLFDDVVLFTRGFRDPMPTEDLNEANKLTQRLREAVRSRLAALRLNVTNQEIDMVTGIELVVDDVLRHFTDACGKHDITLAANVQPPAYTRYHDPHLALEADDSEIVAKPHVLSTCGMRRNAERMERWASSWPKETAMPGVNLFAAATGISWALPRFEFADAARAWRGSKRFDAVVKSVVAVFRWIVSAVHKFVLDVSAVFDPSVTFVLATVVSFAPFVGIVALNVFGDYQRVRYATITDRNTMEELYASLSFIPGTSAYQGGEQSLATDVSVWMMYLFALLYFVEPLLVVGSSQAFGNLSRTASIRECLLSVVRVVWTLLLCGLFWLACCGLLCYLCLAISWWVLGAIIAPDYMLVVATAVITFFVATARTLSSYMDLRAESMEKMRHKILELFLAAIRRTPHKNVAEKIEDIVESDVLIKVGTLMDAASSDPKVAIAGIAELAEAHGVPEPVVLLLLAAASRTPESIVRGVTSAFKALGVDDEVAALGSQMACLVAGAPASTQKLTSTLIDLLPDDSEIQTLARENETTIAAAVQALSSLEGTAADRDVMIAFAVKAAAITVSKESGGWLSEQALVDIVEAVRRGVSDGAFSHAAAAAGAPAAGAHDDRALGRIVAAVLKIAETEVRGTSLEVAKLLNVARQLALACAGEQNSLPQTIAELVPVHRYPLALTLDVLLDHLVNFVIAAGNPNNNFGVTHGVALAMVNSVVSADGLLSSVGLQLRQVAPAYEWHQLQAPNADEQSLQNALRAAMAYHTKTSLVGCVDTAFTESLQALGLDLLREAEVQAQNGDAGVRTLSRDFIEAITTPSSHPRTVERAAVLESLIALYVAGSCSEVDTTALTAHLGVEEDSIQMLLDPVVIAQQYPELQHFLPMLLRCVCRQKIDSRDTATLARSFVDDPVRGLKKALLAAGDVDPDTSLQVFLWLTGASNRATEDDISSAFELPFQPDWIAERDALLTFVRDVSTHRVDTKNGAFLGNAAGAFDYGRATNAATRFNYPNRVYPRVSDVAVQAHVASLRNTLGRDSQFKPIFDDQGHRPLPQRLLLAWAAVAVLGPYVDGRAVSELLAIVLGPGRVSSIAFSLMRLAQGAVDPRDPNDDPHIAVLHEAINASHLWHPAHKNVDLESVRRALTLLYPDEITPLDTLRTLALGPVEHFAGLPIQRNWGTALAGIARLDGTCPVLTLAATVLNDLFVPGPNGGVDLTKILLSLLPPGATFVDWALLALSELQKLPAVPWTATVAATIDLMTATVTFLRAAPDALMQWASIQPVVAAAFAVVRSVPNVAAPDALARAEDMVNMVLERVFTTILSSQHPVHDSIMLIFDMLTPYSLGLVALRRAADAMLQPFSDQRITPLLDATGVSRDLAVWVARPQHDADIALVTAASLQAIRVSQGAEALLADVDELLRNPNDATYDALVAQLRIIAGLLGGDLIAALNAAVPALQRLQQNLAPLQAFGPNVAAAIALLAAAVAELPETLNPAAEKTIQILHVLDHHRDDVITTLGAFKATRYFFEEGDVFDRGMAGAKVLLRCFRSYIVSENVVDHMRTITEGAREGRNDKRYRLVRSLVGSDARPVLDAVMSFLAMEPDGLQRVIALFGVARQDVVTTQLLATLDTLYQMAGVVMKTERLKPTNPAEFIAWQIFTEVDTSNNDEITLDEFRAALRRLHFPVSEARSKRLFKEMDITGRGVLVREEFLRSLLKIQGWVMEEILAELHLTKSIIYAAVAYIAVIVLILLVFIVCGAYAFSDGTIFTACITGLMPLAALTSSAASQRNAALKIKAKVVSVVEKYFDRLQAAVAAAAAS